MDGTLSSGWRKGLRLTALALVIVAGLATAAATRYRPAIVYRRWYPVHQVLVRFFIDPIRLRAHGSLGVVRKARDFWVIERENQSLRREVTRLDFSNQMLREQMARTERLTGLGRWGAPPEIAFLPADVIAVDTFGGVMLSINRGDRDGIRVRDPVVALGGLVGIVRSISAHSAEVQSITDPLSVVGAVGLGEGGRRARGVVYGRGRNHPLEFVPENEIQPIDPGTLLISSGFKNSVFPKGLVIGVIDQRGVDPYGLPFGVARPIVPLDSVEEVLVVLPKSRAAGDAIKPSLSTDGLSTAGLSISLSMPVESVRSWTLLSTSTQHMLLDNLSSLGSDSLLTTSLTQALDNAATTAPQAAVVLPKPTPAPDSSEEPPVPSVDSWMKNRDTDGDWSSQNQHEGNE